MYILSGYRGTYIRGVCTFGALQPTANFSKNWRGTYFRRGTYLRGFTVFMRVLIALWPSHIRRCCLANFLLLFPTLSFSLSLSLKGKSQGSCQAVTTSTRSSSKTLRYCKTLKLKFSWRLIFVNFVNSAKLRKLVFTKGIAMRILIDGRPKFTKNIIYEPGKIKYCDLRKWVAYETLSLYSKFFSCHHVYTCKCHFYSRSEE